MSKWENKTFGKAGKFYPILYLLPLPILGVALFLFGYSFASGFQPWERMVVGGFGVFFLIHFVRAIEAIVISRSTIQEITTDNTIFHVKTFGGSDFKVKQFSKIVEDDAFLAKKNLRFLFPNESKNIIVNCDSRNYYISGNTEKFETLRAALNAASEHIVKVSVNNCD
jgi:hypothetical protein